MDMKYIDETIADIDKKILKLNEFKKITKKIPYAEFEKIAELIAERQILINEIVITSYSIHYTKLYEITQNQMTRQYLNNTNSALTNMNEINNKILSQRKFTRASQDSVGAAKALIIRRNLEKTEMYKSNLDTADTIFSAAEKSLLSISNSSTTLTDSIVQGVNGTQGDDERKILAEQIRNIAKEMISQINTEYADRNNFV